MVVVKIIGTSLLFLYIFMVALGGYPFEGAQGMQLIGGAFIGIVSGVTWGTSVHGSKGWSDVMNWIAALAALVSLAYLTADTFQDKVCKVDQTERLCQVTQLFTRPTKFMVEALTHWR